MSKVEIFHKKAFELVKTPNNIPRADYDEHTKLSTHESINQMLKFRDILYEKGYCYVKITDKRNDYYGSIAKFVLSDPEDEYRPNHIQITYRCDSYNINMYFNGRLRWKGKSNKPKYCLKAGDVVLTDEDIDTVFKRVNKKEKQQSALLQGEYDIDGNKLEVGDKVLCLSIIYGGGSALRHGVIESFKAVHSNGHTRVETYVKLDGSDYVQKCNYTSEQIYKKPIKIEEVKDE